MSSGIQFSHVRAFEALARHHNYTRAAEELCYSEPAVHMQVKALERLLSLQLVKRRGQQTVLTREGEQLLQHAQAVVDRMAGLEQAARGLKEEGMVTVAAGRHTAAFHLIPMLADFARDNPEADVDVRIPAVPDMVQGVIDGTYDMAVAGTLNRVISRDERRRHRLTLVPWQRDSWVVIGDPVNRRTTLRTRRIYAPSFYSVSEKANEDLCRDPRTGEMWDVIKLDTEEAVRSAALNGLGLALFPVSSIREDANLGRLTVLRSSPEATQTCYVLHRHVALLTPRCRDFLRVLIRNGRLWRNRAEPPAILAG